MVELKGCQICGGVLSDAPRCLKCGTIHGTIGDTRPAADEALRIAVEALEEVSTWYGEETQRIARQAIAKIKELGK